MRFSSLATEFKLEQKKPKLCQNFAPKIIIMVEKSKMKVKKAKKMENLKIQMLANSLYDEEHFDLALEKERILEHFVRQGRATATPNCRCRSVAQNLT